MDQEYDIYKVEIKLTYLQLMTWKIEYSGDLVVIISPGFTG